VSTTPDIAAFEAVKAENALLRQRIVESEEKAARQGEELARMQHELAQLKRLIYGTRSERFEGTMLPDQLGLFGGAQPVEVAPVKEELVTRRAPERKPVRHVLPSHLPREVIVIEPEIDTAGLKKIGEEVTETLDYRPAKLIVIKRVRPKYVDPKDEAAGVYIGALPPRPVDKGMAEPGLLAHVTIEKYVDHLPIYRQAQRFRRQGITIPESTLGGWIAATADLLLPLYDVLKTEVIASGYLQADETPIPVQDQDKPGTTHRGYYWVYHAPERRLVMMDYQEGRGRAGPAGWLTGYQGALQSDGYTAYEHFDRLPGITGYGCWAHARRYFFEAKDNDPARAEHALAEIGRLYAIERELAEGEASAGERLRVRLERAVPVLETFRVWLEDNRSLPKSPWGAAVGYALARWEKLTRYTADGRIEIDNNLVENAIRPIALGRKNYLFAGSHDAAKRAAVIYSVLATCKRNGINPQNWLADVLERIPTHPQKQIDELLPHRWTRLAG
jgi:transposase